MEDTLTWLHLSDIHFNRKTEWRDKNQRAELLKHLKSIFASDSTLVPDLIFCTGDIAFGDSNKDLISEQYLKAQEFFEELRAVSGKNQVLFPKDHLFVVPGNHDVNRSKINLDAQETMIQKARDSEKHVDSVNNRIDKKTQEFVESIRRLDEYSDFIQNYLPHQLDQSGRHCFTKVTEIRGKKIGIAGFNSAWSCAGSEDDRNIWLAANWQFNMAKEGLESSDIKIGLIHHPNDWFNPSDRAVANRRISSNFHFWLHGHSHDAWVTPSQSHILISAGAVGAQKSDEFGINIVSLDLRSRSGNVHLHRTNETGDGWTIAPVAGHAPNGIWNFNLPTSLDGIVLRNVSLDRKGHDANAQCPVLRILDNRFNTSLQTFSSPSPVWVTPILSKTSELDNRSKNDERIELQSLIDNPISVFVKAPPQYGLSCLAHFMIREAWRSSSKSFWLYLDTRSLKPHLASVIQTLESELQLFGMQETDIKCIILDSWSASEKNNMKLLRACSDRFPNIPIMCMEQLNYDLMNVQDTQTISRHFEQLFMRSISRSHIREIVISYNQQRQIGDEDAIINRIVKDLDTLNLHRTALNCLTLLKVSEVDFDENPVNRTELIKRVLFILFNLDEIPTYKTRPDLTDCMHVLGFFCEQLIRNSDYVFTRDNFLVEAQRFCKDQLIDIETHLVFDLLHANSIIVKVGHFFSFKFSYWVFFFAAQRMHQDTNFLNYIFDLTRYAQYPELIEFYTGLDRRREDALTFLKRDLQKCQEEILNKSGLPVGINPYKFAYWEASDEERAHMQEEVTNGVKNSNLPAVIKDRFADRTYNPSRPYNQEILDIFRTDTFAYFFKLIRASARALRNSDYATPRIRREVLTEILKGWEVVSTVLFVISPILSEQGHAGFDGMSFEIGEDFSDNREKRAVEIFSNIPGNVMMWYSDDLFSIKMGPLLYDALNLNQIVENVLISDIAKHELVLLLIHNRPRDWEKYVSKYIFSVGKNSFYLWDVKQALNQEYRYSFANTRTLSEIAHLIKLAAAKHITGVKEPSLKTISKVKFSANIIPDRDASLDVNNEDIKSRD